MTKRTKWERRNRKLRKRRYSMRLHGKRIAEVIRNARRKRRTTRRRNEHIDC